jgi:exodeoxyribonuclease-3
LRFATWNVNGLRSAMRQGFGDWLGASGYDVVCLQETKMGADLVTGIEFPGYEAHWNPSHRPGHSGVATLVRKGIPARVVGTGIGVPDLDLEGRVLCVEAGGVRFVNVYAPHSHRKLLRREAKGRFLAGMDPHATPGTQEGAPVVLLGDFNVAHADIDLANARANRGNAGFLPEEREWVDLVLSRGFVDAFRQFEPGGGHYTWWSMRQGVRERNVGWRLDYAFVDPSLRDRLVSCRHLAERRGSDHCPVEVEIDTSFV